MAKSKVEETSEISEMRPKKVAWWLTSIVGGEERIPVFLWGAPGIGKSQIVRQVAQKLGMGLVDVRMTLLDPTDLRGIPVPHEDTARWLAPTFLPQVGRDGERGILLLDELNSAPPLVQAAGYQLVLDGRIGEYVLPPGWHIVGAGNRAEDRAVTYPMPTALADRFLHIFMGVNSEDWLDWALHNQIDSKILAFLHYDSQFLFKFDPTTKNGRLTFATPRSWENVSKLARITSMQDLEQSNILSGLLGEAVAQQFRMFLRCYGQLPDLDKIMKGADIVPEERSLQYAVLTALVSRVKDDKTLSRVVEYAMLPNFTEELGVLVGKILLTSAHRSLMLRSPVFHKWSGRFKEFVVAD